MRQRALSADGVYNNAMTDDDANQVLVPASFTALFVPPGKLRPTQSRHAIATRHELCEDLAQMLIDPARRKLHELQCEQEDVLQRMRLGLDNDGPALAAPLTSCESDWVVHRLAELLEWKQPTLVPVNGTQ